MKICSKCNAEKSIQEFHNRKDRVDGKFSICKSCDNEAYNNRRKANLKRYREKEVLWQKKNRKKCRESSAKWYAKNKEKHKDAGAKWFRENPGKVKEYNRRSNLKQQSTVKGRLSNNIKSRMWHSLRGDKNGEHWENLVGYTIEELKIRLNQTMPRNWTWKNYMEGKLHIDHIIPISVFNFKTSKDYDFKRCWALDNLQLLPARENQIKSMKLDKPFQPSLLM